MPDKSIFTIAFAKISLDHSFSLAFEVSFFLVFFTDAFEILKNLGWATLLGIEGSLNYAFIVVNNCSRT